MYEIFLSEEAIKFLVNLDRKSEEIVRNKIKKLGEFPESFGKHLRGIDLWSARIGKYRVLFEVDKEKKRILIMTIGHRKNVYYRLKEKR